MSPGKSCNLYFRTFFRNSELFMIYYYLKWSRHETHCQFRSDSKYLKFLHWLHPGKRWGNFPRAQNLRASPSECATFPLAAKLMRTVCSVSYLSFHAARAFHWRGNSQFRRSLSLRRIDGEKKTESEISRIRTNVWRTNALDTRY